MAKDLRKAYKKEFEAMYADALENRHEANEARVKAEKELAEARSHLEKLNETAKSCRGNFVNDAKELIKYGLTSSPVLYVLKKIADNILLFVSSKEEVPEAEDDIARKEEVLGDCAVRFANAVTDVRAIESFITKND